MAQVSGHAWVHLAWRNYCMTPDSGAFKSSISGVRQIYSMRQNCKPALDTPQDRQAISARLPSDAARRRRQGDRIEEPSSAAQDDTIATKRTWQRSSAMSAHGGKTDIEPTGRHFRFCEG